MKRLLFFIVSVFVFIHPIWCETININWMVGDSVYDTSTCTVGDDLIIPTTPPTKYGYHFVGWSNFIWLKYIESTGTQFINTGIIPTLQTGAYVKFSLSSLKNTDNIIFGASDAIGFNNGRAFSIDPFKNYTFFAFGNFTSVDGTYKIQSGEISKDTIYEASLNYFNDRKAVFDDKQKVIPVATAMTTQPIYLFGINYAGGSSLGTDSANGARIYSFIITENDSIIFNLKPVKRLSDNAIGMFDTVTHTFFTNSGTGTFLAGPAL